MKIVLSQSDVSEAVIEWLVTGGLLKSDTNAVAEYSIYDKETFLTIREPKSKVDLPKKLEEPKQNKTNVTAIEDIGDQPINLDDIEF